MKSIIGVVLAVASLVAARPAEAASPCEVTTGEAKPLSVDITDRDTFVGFSAGMLLGLTPRTFPYDNVAKQKDACTRGEFTARAKTYRVYGGGDDSPPRWAVGPDPKKIAYVAIVPPLKDALQWAKNADKSSGLAFHGPSPYVLAVTNGDTRDIFGVFESMPGDDQLRTLMKGALEGSLQRIAVFNEKTGETIFAAR